ncbi:flavodoxin reductase [Niabella ginsenosidivorans]|uniref:Flavodoxin reductase n=1 Tax=Niabella ginsenosidivorans TaxID=1176587 RepID=A0A1A9I2G6_9BACT|nr:FAD-binding oxidoreductase [Niabella ginsenosidivorans]ANH81525.1 flavodoxin reductase [Niabella ginsenosidivorans]
MSEKHIVKILSTDTITHDVKRFEVEKPQGYGFIPGQATEISIHKAGWQDKRNPFTFTSLNEWDHLEFTIKIYDNQDGVTHQLGLLQPGDELILHDVWGAIQYKGAGCFIAGGAGVTPFIAIFRQLHKEGLTGNNKLFFSNKTVADIILKDEFTKMLGQNFINTITQENAPGYDHRRIDEAYLKDMIRDFDQHFYICGPDLMVQTVQQALKNLGSPESVITVEI